MSSLSASAPNDVARYLCVSPWLVKDVEKRWLGKHFARPRLKDLKHIAIDQIATRKGHKYLTIVMDLESGAVVYVGPGKGADALSRLVGERAEQPFWVSLKAAPADVEAVAIDMSAAYFSAVCDNLPDAAVVFDWFHVLARSPSRQGCVKLLNDKLSQLRRQLFREATDQLHKDVLKGTRWLLLKRPENLDETRDESQRLQEALDLNASLATAYYLKEDLRLLWEEPTKHAAGRFLDDWIRQAHASGIRVLQTFAKTLARYRTGILAWYDHPISTGPLEGTNNKIKTRWVFADRQGNVRDVVEIDGTTVSLVEHQNYDSFGGITSDTNPSYEFRFGYTGRLWDSDAQLQFNGARWYDAKLGKFLSEDPLGFAAGDANLTRYVVGDPVNFTDPSGLFSLGGFFEDIGESIGQAYDDSEEWMEKQWDDPVVHGAVIATAAVAAVVVAGPAVLAAAGGAGAAGVGAEGVSIAGAATGFGTAEAVGFGTAFGGSTLGIAGSGALGSAGSIGFGGLALAIDPIIITTAASSSGVGLASTVAGAAGFGGFAAGYLSADGKIVGITDLGSSSEEVIIRMQDSELQSPSYSGPIIQTGATSGDGLEL